MSLKTNNAHLIGIGGCGMSGIAKILLDMRIHVSGCDLNTSPVVEELSRLGAAMSIGHDPSHVAPPVDLVVASAAVKPDHPELLQARRLNVPILKYAHALGQLMADRTGIAVSGTHGKTTTSAMISFLLLSAGLDPSFVIGSPVASVGDSSRVGKGPHFVVEACEYDRSFHALSPVVAVTTNIEEDHLDYYHDLDEIVESFADFARLLPSDGLYVVNAENPPALRAARASAAPVHTFAIALDADWQARDLHLVRGCYAFSVDHNHSPFGEFQLRIPGIHNVSNALAAIAVAHYVDIPSDLIAQHLRDFVGTRRRFERLGDPAGITLVDDYAHHPTEIRATLAAARQLFPQRRLVVVFQPHQYSRTRFLLADFAASFDNADVLVVPDIYFVRDSEFERTRVNSGQLVDEIARRRVRVLYLPSFPEIEEFLTSTLKPDDVLITMGAGNVNEIAYNLLDKLRAAV